MLADLAMATASALLGAAATDTWTVARVRLLRTLRSLGGGDAGRRQAIQSDLDETADAFRAVSPADRDGLRGQLLPGWTDRISELLHEYPGLAPDLRAFAHEFAPPGSPPGSPTQVNVSRDSSTMFVSQGAGPVTHVHGGSAGKR
jgi:hypothetical protein